MINALAAQQHEACHAAPPLPQAQLTSLLELVPGTASKRKKTPKKCVAAAARLASGGNPYTDHDSNIDGRTWQRVQMAVCKEVQVQVHVLHSMCLRICTVQMAAPGSRYIVDPTPRKRHSRHSRLQPCSWYVSPMCCVPHVLCPPGAVSPRSCVPLDLRPPGPVSPVPVSPQTHPVAGCASRTILPASLKSGGRRMAWRPWHTGP